MILELLTRIVSHPAVSGLLPVLVEMLSKFLVERAERLEFKAATRSARAAKTAEELRRASERLANALRGDR